MKTIKIFTALLLTAVLCISTVQLSVITTKADSFFDDGDFRYAVKSDDTLEVAQYYGTETALTLPERVADRLVTGIHARCFQGSAVSSVIIPRDYTSIGAFAFSGCEQLTAVSLPSSLKTIGMMAFYGCNSLSTIDFSVAQNLQTIGLSAFSGCSSLTAVNLPDTLTAIGESAFSNCALLTSVHLPNELTSIGSYAFYGDTSLDRVDFPLSLESIGESAFENDIALGGIFIPDSVTYIGDNAFAPMVTDGSFVVQCFENTLAAAYFTAQDTANLSLYQKLTGDVNLDGTLTVVDVTVIQKYIADLEPLDMAVLRDLADIDRNGEINIADATAGQRKIAGYEDEI